MNFLIVMPYIIAPGKLRKPEYMIPLGVMCISSSLKAAGFNVFTLNLNHYAEPYSELQKKIANNNIDVILTGGLSVNFSILRHTFNQAKAVNPDIITICGGGIISGDPQAAMQAFNDLDFGIIGEGEITVCELAHALETGANIDNISGIIYKHDMKYIQTQPRAEIKNIDELPFPDYDGFEYKKYIDQYCSSNFEELHVDIPTLQSIFTQDISIKKGVIAGSRSCPFSCTFCFHTSGQKYRQHSLDYIFKELDFLIEKYGINIVFFQDELFASSAQRVKDFCKRIKPYNIPWRVNLRANNITEDLIKTMKESGCIHVIFGIENINDSILEGMNKRITREQIENGLYLVKKYKLGKATGNLLFGDIYETEETIQNSIDWWREKWQIEISLLMIQVYPGSYIYKYALENNLITDPVQFLIDGCPHVNISKLSSAKINDLKNTITYFTRYEKRATVYPKLLDYNKQTNKANFEWTCKICKRKYISHEHDLYKVKKVSCQDCIIDYIPVIPRILAANIEQNIIHYMKETNHNLGLWGINLFAYYLLKESNLTQLDNLFLIDDDKQLDGIEIFNKKIVPSSMLQKLNIDTLIVTGTNHFDNFKIKAQNILNREIDFKIIHDFADEFKSVNILDE